MDRTTTRATVTDIWAYPDYETLANTDISGFSVEALDGSIGKVDESSFAMDGGYIVVDTGPWIFGTKAMLPAGVIDRVDIDDRRVWVNRTKDEIKNAPEFDESTYRDTQYRTDLGGYYGQGGTGWRDW
jgi:hypothetical protein